MATRAGTPGDELLRAEVRRLYVDLRHSDREVAEALGVTRVTVSRWRARWGIARADRRIAAPILAQGGQQ